MAPDPLAEFYKHRVAVRTKKGDSANGPIYASSQQLYGFAAAERTMTRDGSGADVVSNTVLYEPLQYADWFTPGSIVTVFGGDAVVVSVARHEDVPGQNLPTCVEVRLA